MRGVFWVLLPIVAGLLLSTVVLRYHYVFDVVAGLCGVPLAFLLWRFVSAPQERRGGMPAAARA